MLPSIRDAELLIHGQLVASLRRTSFGVGDFVVVETISQIGKKRSQHTEGIVISKRGTGINTTFTVRRIALGFGIEVVVQLLSPLVVSVRTRSPRRTRRAKLYYLRNKTAKSHRLAGRIPVAR